MAKHKSSVSRFLVSTRYAFLRTVWIDALSLLYSVYVYTVNYDKFENRLFELLFLCVAKYHGFSISLSLLAAHWTLCYSLREIVRVAKRLIASCRSGEIFQPEKDARLFDKPCHDHVMYGIRFVYSMLIHSIVHVTLTHSLRSIILRLGRFEVSQLWYSYRWTITGYLLLLLSLFLLLSGRRLTRFARNHVTLRNCHVTAYVFVVALFSAHSSNYPMLVLSLTLVSAEWSSVWLRSMHRVTVDSVTVFRESPDALDVVMEFEFTSERLAKKFRCGDHVRVYAPVVSWFEMHTFALIPIADRSCAFRLLVRTVGEWTKRLYTVDRSRLGRLWICGPFHNGSEVELERLFPRTLVYRDDAFSCFPKENAEEFRHDYDLWYDNESLSADDFDVVSLRGDEAPRDALYWVDPNLQLCLICTGISITRHLAILTHFVSRYRSATTTTTRVCCEKEASVRVRSVLPCRIRLIWSVGRLFDVNLAVSTLDNLQRCLSSRGWQSLLTYDIFVSKTPSSHDRTVNQRFCSFLTTGLSDRVSIDDFSEMLVKEQWSNDSDRRLRCDSSVLLNSYSSVSNRWRKTRLYLEREDESLRHGSKDATVSLFGNIFSNAAFATNDRQQSSAKRTKNAFSSFYANATVTSGKRVSNWDRVVLDDRDNERDRYDDVDHFFGNIDSSVETVIILTTGVESIKSQIRRVAETRPRVKLYVEQLW